MPRQQVVYEMDDQAMSLDGLLGTLRRRKWFFLVPFLLVSAAAAALAFGLPPVYRSTGTILIERQELPTDLVRSTVASYVDERVATVQQRVMTAANLSNLMETHDLYPELRQGEDESGALSQMRRDVTLETTTAEVVDPRTGRPTEATISFSVSYDAPSPEVAQAVASDLVDRFLEENRKERQKVTREASRFLEQESAKISGDIAELEKRLADFKSEAGASLPEMLNSNIEFMQRIQERLRDVDESIRSVTEGTILLEGELARTEPYLELLSPEGERVLPPTEQLKLLEAQALALSGRYSAEHPDRVKVERELNALRAALRGSGRSPYASDADNPAYVQLRSRILANQAELDSLKESRSDLTEQLEIYEQRIAAAPVVERDYLALTRDYESALARYEDVRSRLMEAKLAESLETESKGERFTVIDPPRLPEAPVKPNRFALMFLGVVLAVGSGLGSVALRQALDQGVYGPRAVERIAGSPPLAVIPFIRVSGRARRRRRRVDSASAG